MATPAATNAVDVQVADDQAVIDMIGRTLLAGDAVVELLQGAAEVEAFIVVNGDDVRHIAQREVRRRVDESRLIALRVPGVHSPDAARFLLRCECEVTIDYGPDPKAVRRIIPVFTSARHMVPALQTHPKWQRLSPVVMDGPNILRVADRYGDLAINPWSECQFLPAT